ncbi:DUF6676 family protein [uncultured Gordonia sp.]|uniref:Rv1476 family membrane protein n=1 Tax=uncultured Gordonia sp. TaxID=198437 RepID=UPI002590C508|nr:DUF6676 family protein [uncultured Gordonia sp.]
MRTILLEEAETMNPGPATDGAQILAAPGTTVLAAPASSYDTQGVTATTAPGGVDLTAIAADLRDDHVYSEDPAQIGALKQVVAHAQADGHDINLVVLKQQMPTFTMYRDIATELQQHVGGTVLVFGPNSVGSASPEFSRVNLEDATDNLTLSNPPQAAQQMVDAITKPGVDWTLVTIVLIAVVVIGAIVGRIRSLRRRDRGAQTSAADLIHGAGGEESETDGKAPSGAVASGSGNDS